MVLCRHAAAIRCFGGSCGQLLRDWLSELACRGEGEAETILVIARVEDQKGVVARRWGTCEANESWGRASSEGAREAEVPGSNN